MMYFMTDLDNTLIYSGGRLAGEKVCVERKDGEELSFMTPSAFDGLARLRRGTRVIPVTTRSLEQYRRISLFHEEIPELALVANGGILLRKGEEDLEWRAQTEALTEDCRGELEKAGGLLRRMEEICFDIRNIDGLFLFTKSTDAEKTARTLRDSLDLRLLSVCVNLQKVYLLPRVLDKGLAVKRLRERLGGCEIIAAGDSIFDIPMLEQADIAVALRGEISADRLGKPPGKGYFWAGEHAGFSDYVITTADTIVERWVKG